MITLPHDKLLHALAGAAAFAIPAGILAGAGLGGEPAAWGGTLGLILAAVGREVYNAVRGGTVSAADVAWTLAGGALPGIACVAGMST